MYLEKVSKPKQQKPEPESQEKPEQKQEEILQNK